MRDAVRENAVGDRRFENLDWFAMSALAALLFIPRLVDLDLFANVDACAHWFGRSLEFYKELYRGDLRGTMTAGHPGVTIMILSGASMIVAGLIQFQTLSLIPYFTDLLFWAKLPIVLITGFGALSVFWILRHYYQSRILGILAAGYIAIDPTFLAHSRFFQLDAVVSMATLLSLMWFAIHHDSRSRKHLAASGVLAGFAMLTKIYAGALAPFVITAIWLRSLYSTDAVRFRDALKNSLIWSTAAGAVFFALWPAMWVAPIDTLMALAGDVGFAVTHTHENLGPVVEGGQGIQNAPQERPLAFDTSLIADLLGRYPPVQLALAALCLPLLSFGRQAVGRGRILVAHLAGFAAFFVIGMSFFGKAGPRYCLIAYLILDVMAAVGTVQLWFIVKHWFHRQRMIAAGTVAVTLSAIALSALSVFSLQPYYGSYHNGLIGNEPLGWGEGLEQVAGYLNQAENSADLTVASFYPCILRRFSDCTAIQLDDLAAEQPDYVVLYRSQVERVLYPEVIDLYLGKQTPEFVAMVNGQEWAWVYDARGRNLDTPSRRLTDTTRYE